MRVVPQPRVVVLSTGDELIDPGTRPGFGQVVDSNSVMLTAALRELGAVPFRVPRVRDDARLLRETLERELLRADAVITTGGVSAGAYDTVKEVLSRVGTMSFDQVAMQPGKPQGFGVLGEDHTPVFTLPGNPVSAMVSFEVFVAPALRRMAGRADHELELVDATAAHDWTSPAGPHPVRPGAAAERGQRAHRRPRRSPGLARAGWAGLGQRPRRGARRGHPRDRRRRLRCHPLGLVECVA